MINTADTFGRECYFKQKKFAPVFYNSARYLFLASTECKKNGQSQANWPKKFTEKTKNRLFIRKVRFRHCRLHWLSDLRHPHELNKFAAVAVGIFPFIRLRQRYDVVQREVVDVFATPQDLRKTSHSTREIDLPF